MCQGKVVRYREENKLFFRFIFFVCSGALSWFMQPGPLTIETRVQPQASPCTVCGGHSGFDIRFIQVVQFPSRQHHFTDAV